MGENRPEELTELEAQARWALEHPEQLEPREAIMGYQPLLRLWHHTTFVDDTCWMLLAPMGRNRSDQHFIVRRVIWERTSDMRRFADPLEWLKQGYRAPPTIIVRDARMPADHLGPLVEELAQAPVPTAGIEEFWGLDGEKFGFENLKSGFLYARLEWWGDGPAEWQAFTNNVAQMRTAFEQCFSGDEQEG